MNYSEQLTTNDFTSTYGEPIGYREMKKYIGEGLKSTGPNLNVINVLRVFIEDEDSILFIPADYGRGSRKRVDSKVHHGHRYAPVAMKVDDFVGSIVRFNFSVRGLKDVMVETDNGLQPKKVFRTYNIIRDGEVFIKRLEAILSESAYELLTSAGVVFDQVGRKVETETPLVDKYIYTIDLSGLPIVSPQWAKPNHIKLYDLLELDVFLTHRTKELNKLKKEYKAKLQVTETIPGSNDVYVESTQYSSDKVKDYYTATFVEYRVKTKKPKFDESELREQFPDYDSVTKQLAFDKKYRSYLRFIYRAAILAIESTKKQGSYEWSEEKPLPRSNKKTFKETTVTNSQGKDVVLQRITWTEEIPV